MLKRNKINFLEKKKYIESEVLGILNLLGLKVKMNWCMGKIFC